MFTIFPILLITILSNALSLDLQSNFVLEPFEVGYSIEKGSKIESFFEVFKGKVQEMPIVFVAMTKEVGLDALENKKIACYVTLDDEKYTLYKNEGLDINTIIVETALDEGLYLYDGINELLSPAYSKFLSSAAIEAMEGSIELPNELILTSKLNADPIPSARDYYGIVQIVFIIWFGIASCLTLAISERKNDIVHRIALSKANATTLFFGRFIPTACCLCFQVGIALTVSTLLLKVNWGSSPLLSFSILLLEVLAISAFGTTISFIIKNVSLVNIGTYVASFIFGFTGGSFQTYIYNPAGDNLAKYSPLYYINRTLVELSINGSSTYFNKTVILLMSVIGLSLIIGIIYSKVRGYKNELI